MFYSLLAVTILELGSSMQMTAQVKAQGLQWRPVISHVNVRIGNVCGNLHLLYSVAFSKVVHCTLLGIMVELIALHCYLAVPSVIDNGVAQTNCICLESLFRSAPRQDL